MRRREFITLLGGAAVGWSMKARAQQGERLRRIGILRGASEADPSAPTLVAAFRQALQELGWTEGRNVTFDYRLAGGDRELLRKYATEMVALKPDVIVASGSGAVGSLQQATRTIPIVFVAVVDPIAGGFVANMARPGGNATGFTNFDYSLAGKWVELLKLVAPRVTRVAILRDPTQFSGGGQLGAAQAIAPSLGVELSPLDVRDTGEIERSLAAFARGNNSGLVVLSGYLAFINRDTIIAAAARHRLTAVYPDREFVVGGGLIGYGTDSTEQFRQAAGYVNRILKGEKPADLPVQAPTKYELLINLKTAKAAGLTIPANLLATANEVIE
jgi:putative ABC transport system substrate-binding protein